MRATLALLAVLLLYAATPVSTANGAPSVAVALDADAYSAVSTLGEGDAPLATITVLGADGLPAAGAQVRVVFIRQVQFVGSITNETALATTGADGTVSVAAPQLSRAPGSYLVVAFALGAAGTDRYTVGA